MDDETMVNVEPLTLERCLDVARTLRAALATLRLTLSTVAPLMRLLGELEWMAGCTQGPADAFLAAYLLHADRAVKAFIGFLQVQDIAAALRACALAVPDRHQIRRALRQRFDRTDVLDAPSQNHLFELEIGGRLGRRGPGLVFEEPDLTYPVSGLGRVGFACKRAQNIHRLRQRIAEGAGQIEGCGRRGVVVQRGATGSGESRPAAPGRHRSPRRVLPLGSRGL